jgi:hypothetical protein
MGGTACYAWRLSKARMTSSAVAISVTVPFENWTIVILLLTIR